MSEWTIETLKEHLEQKIEALKDKAASDNALLTAAQKSAEEALQKQATEYERRLSGLNHEAERINAANASNVSREVYDNDQKSNDQWRRSTEGLLANVVTKTEFSAYEKSTSTALTLQAGGRAAIGSTGQILFGMAVAVSAIIGAIYVMVPPHTVTPPAPIIYVTPTTPPPGDPATIKVKP